MRLRPLNEDMDGVYNNMPVEVPRPHPSSPQTRSRCRRRPEARQYIVAGSRGRTVSIDEQS